MLENDIDDDDDIINPFKIVSELDANITRESPYGQVDFLLDIRPHFPLGE
jgi:hypothetical protein